MQQACQRIFAVSAIIVCVPFFAAGRAVAQVDQPPSRVLFINQVRAEECCQPGNLKNLDTQISAFRDQQIPAFFTLRYDVIVSSRYSNYLKQQTTAAPQLLQLGVFLEITPQLAKDAGVEYRGHEQNWYEAEHAYPIGYSPTDRIKLVDKLFSAFHQTFGYYPELTSGWIVDTPTLNYLHDSYGVKLHQLTREQWSTDSYTLDGGPPHYPYPASRSWAFIPDYGQDRPLLMVRQTVTDPIWNYGDPTSSFTSQPNDYQRDGKDISYFTNLVNQALNEQPPGQPGWALLGLENSMAEPYQQEYLAQIKVVKSILNDSIQPVSDLQVVIDDYIDREVSIYTGSDHVLNNNSQIAWVTAPSYRIRLLFKDDRVLITDLRLYQPDLVDPYTEYQAQAHGYWITPFLIDSSRFFDSKLPWWRVLLNLTSIKPWWQEYGLATANDLQTAPSAIHLGHFNPDSSLQFSRESSAQLIKYQTPDHRELYFKFSPQNFQLHYSGQKPTVYYKYQGKTGENSILFGGSESSNISLGSTAPPNTQLDLRSWCLPDEAVCIFDPEVNLRPEPYDQQTPLYPYYFPETRSDPADPDKSVIYAHNQYAIAGRNPIRVVLIAKNQDGFPTQITETPLLELSKPVDSSTKLEKLQTGIYFVDLHQATPLKTSLQIQLPGSGLDQTQTIFFAPDCKQQPFICLKHPNQAWWYLQTVIRDMLRPYRW